MKHIKKFNENAVHQSELPIVGYCLTVECCEDSELIERYMFKQVPTEEQIEKCRNYFLKAYNESFPDHDYLETLDDIEYTVSELFDGESI